MQTRNSIKIARAHLLRDRSGDNDRALAYGHPVSGEVDHNSLKDIFSRVGLLAQVSAGED